MRFPYLRIPVNVNTYSGNTPEGVHVGPKWVFTMGWNTHLSAVSSNHRAFLVSIPRQSTGNINTFYLPVLPQQSSHPSSVQESVPQNNALSISLSLILSPNLIKSYCHRSPEISHPHRHTPLAYGAVMNTCVFRAPVSQRRDCEGSNKPA